MLAVALLADSDNSVWKIISGASDYLDKLSSNWWFLLIILGIAMLDSVFPVVPGETVVIIGGVAAGQGNQWLILVIAAGAGGAFVGDNLAYQVGSSLKRPIRRRAETRTKLGERLGWATRQIRTRGGMLLITVRFIPGGRTLLTISSGLTDQPRRWFMGWVGAATIIWASFAAGLGYIFGEAFEDNHTLAFLIAFTTAIAITVLIEVVRHFRGRSNDQDESSGRP